jgi:hypothetical protein
MGIGISTTGAPVASGQVAGPSDACRTDPVAVVAPATGKGIRAGSWVHFLAVINGDP